MFWGSVVRKGGDLRMSSEQGVENFRVAVSELEKATTPVLHQIIGVALEEHRPDERDEEGRADAYRVRPSP
jgi:hypothetical protein